MADQPPVPQRAQQVVLDAPQVHHVQGWGRMTDVERLAFIRKIILRRGRDPRIAKLCVGIFRKAGVKPRDYKGQATALLAWVQDPKNFYYVNEPAERLQDPIYSIRTKHGDCLPAETRVLRQDYTFCTLENLKPGDVIWGYKSWTRVQDVWQTGKKTISHIKLSNKTTLRVSPDHRVFVWSCPLHGATCPDFTKRHHNCIGRREFKIIEVRVSDLEPGMRILRPSSIPYGNETADSRSTLVEGYYLADGWINHKYEKKDGTTTYFDFCISGKDGHPKQAQKEEVERICGELGIPTRMDKRYIAVRSGSWAERLSQMGEKATNKRALTINYTKESADALLRGILADSGLSDSGSLVFSSTSEELTLQVRMLAKMQGISCGMTYVSNHGGLGKNPIYRLTLWKENLNGEMSLSVKEVRHFAEEDVTCYDLTTEDHYVYLPETDTVVHNCDDAAILLCALFESVRLPWKLVLSGRHRYTGQKIRYVEGQPRNPAGNWTHIYCAVGTPPFAPKKWYFCEPTVQGVPLGWDVIDGDHSVLPEMAGIPDEVRELASASPMGALPRPGTSSSAVSSAISGAVAAEADNPSARIKSVAFGILAGAMTAIVSQIVLTEYRYWREDKREEEKKRRKAEATARGETVTSEKEEEEEE